MEINAAITIPIKGAMKMNASVLVILSTSMLLKPACAMAAPAKPPIRVCEDDEGIPNHQVSRFQMIAAMSPEKMTGKVITSW
jgi:hypothetical protein